MKWYKFRAKRSKKGSKVSKGSVHREFLEMDFFCQLTYMAAIATSGIGRVGLFYRASKLPYVSARYFKKVDFVAKAFNHDYSEACRIVGEVTKEPEAKALLLRLSGALASGEDTATFLERESEVLSESYGNHYQGCLETLSKWTDAYIALVMTSAIVTVVAVVSMMIGSTTIGFIAGITATTILANIGGSWLLNRTSPKEMKTHSLPYRSREQDLARKLIWLTLPLGAVIVLYLLMMKVDLDWLMFAASVSLFPVGIIGIIDDKKIDKRDIEIAGFLRSLGGVSQAIGATATEALGRLDFRSMGSLNKNVSLLYTRLLAGINPNLCWDRFVGETGSEQVNRSVRIFWDGVTLGGEPQRVGNDASSFAMKIALLRAKRRLIANAFAWLAIVMHLVITGLVVFIHESLNTFSGFVESMMSEQAAMETMPTAISGFGIFSSSSVEQQLLYSMVVVTIIVLTFANAFAIYSTCGGHIFKLSFYLAVTTAISGASLVFIPPMVRMMYAAM